MLVWFYLLVKQRIINLVSSPCSGAPGAGLATPQSFSLRTLFWTANLDTSTAGLRGHTKRIRHNSQVFWLLFCCIITLRFIVVKHSSTAVVKKKNQALFQLYVIRTTMSTTGKHLSYEFLSNNFFKHIRINCYAIWFKYTCVGDETLDIKRLLAWVSKKTCFLVLSCLWWDVEMILPLAMAIWGLCLWMK